MTRKGNESLKMILNIRFSGSKSYTFEAWGNFKILSKIHNEERREGIV